MELGAIVLRTRTNRDPVPRVDQRRGERQVGGLLFRKETLQTVEALLARVTLGYERHFFGPLQSGALFFTEGRAFMPGVEQQEPLWVLSIPQGFIGVHSDAEGATVDLGGTQFNQVIELLIELPSNRLLQPEQMLVSLGRELRNVHLQRLDHFGTPLLLIETGAHMCSLGLLVQEQAVTGVAA